LALVRCLTTSHRAMGRFSEWLARSQLATKGLTDGNPHDATANAFTLEEEHARENLNLVLPMGFRIGMRVRITATISLSGKQSLLVERGTGEVMAYADQEHVMVQCDRAYRDGVMVHFPLKLKAADLERHPLETMPLDPRTAPASADVPDGELPAATVWKDWEMPKRPQVKPPELGSGALYEVVGDRAAHRAAPSLAAPILGCKLKGRCLELFEWDVTRLWRRCVDDKTWLSGWVMLDSPEFGPLLRPKGLPFQVKPHEPLCIAAREDNLEHLQAFLRDGLDPNVQDAGGCTPLGVAAAAGHLDICVLLLQAGADVIAGLAHQEEPRGRSEKVSINVQLARDLLLGFAGRLGNKLDRLGLVLDALLPEVREAADGMLRDHADESLRLLGWKRHLGKQGSDELVAVDNASEEGEDSLVQPEEDAAENPKDPPMKYEVVTKTCAVRAAPSMDARAIGARKSGAIVELHEFDETGLWRKLPAGSLGENRGDGWMLLYHEVLGQLLRVVESES